MAWVVAALALAGCGKSDVELAHKVVAEQLANPLTAKFTNVRVTDDGTVCGKIRGKDAAGEYTPYQRYVVIKKDSGFLAIIERDGNDPQVSALCGAAAVDEELHADATSADGFDVQIAAGSNMGALSDMTARLIEKGFVPNVARRDGVTVVLLGPFATKAEADEKKARLMAEQGIESFVVKHRPTP
nr:SPOR domain-containing protein [Pseudomonas sp. R5(2019)]